MLQGKDLIDYLLRYHKELDMDRVPQKGRHPIWLTRTQVNSISFEEVKRPIYVYGTPILVYGEDNPFGGGYYPMAEKQLNFCPNCGVTL